MPLFSLERYSEALDLMARTPAAAVDVPACQAAAYALTGDAAKAAASLEKFLADFEEKIIFGRTPEPGEALRWLIHVNPFRRPGDIARLERGVRLAGLDRDPEEDQNLITSARSVGKANQPVFRKEGGLWTLSFEGLTTQLSDMKGFHDVAELIAHPQEPLHCLDLAGRSAESAGNDEVDPDRSGHSQWPAPAGTTLHRGAHRP